MNDWIRTRRRMAVLYDELARGEYVQLWRDHPSHDGIWAVMRCAQCGELSSVGRTLHSVDWRGVVSPASVCPIENCQTVGWIYLQDWRPETKGNA